jgi:hypothetical protein
MKQEIFYETLFSEKLLAYAQEKSCVGRHRALPDNSFHFSTAPGFRHDWWIRFHLDSMGYSIRGQYAVSGVHCAILSNSSVNENCYFFVSSFILGVNFSLFDLFFRSNNLIVQSEIERVIDMRHDKLFDGTLPVISHEPAQEFLKPTPLGINVGGDEGCMCLYFCVFKHISTERCVRRS